MGTPQSIVKKLIIKDDYVKRDGTAALYLYVSVDGEWDRLPLKLSWPPEHFDKGAGRLQARRKDDPDLTDYNLMIEAELAKLNEIIKSYRLGERKITLAVLLNEYNSYTSRLDFLAFYQAEVKERYKRKKIEIGTRNGHAATLNTLREFWQHETRSVDKPLPFIALTPKLLENFRAWLKTGGRHQLPSTAENNMKNVRTYVNRALDAKYVFDNPFKVVKVRPPETFPDVLQQEQLLTLLDAFNANATPDAWRKVLRHFLFSCFTGLRISDVQRVNHTNIQDDWLVLMPKKTLGKQKTVRIPLHPQARTFIVTTTDELFDTYTDQYTNRTLKKIGQAYNIPWELKTHTARHTFGTIFIELGGDVVTLKDYMGHRDLKTTMKYVHLSERRKAEKILVFDKLLSKRSVA